MCRQAIMISRKKRLAVYLAAVSVLLLGSSSFIRAGGEKGGRGSEAAAEPIRVSPGHRGKQRLAEERAMVKALEGKRDPFKVPPPPQENAGGDEITGPLPPGARGLLIGQLSLKGIVREDANNKMIAVVTNRTNLAYFLHVNEDVYNGVVTRITPDAIYFQQRFQNGDGRTGAREVVLKLGSEQQEAR
jgi:hypothetical protein